MRGDGVWQTAAIGGWRGGEVAAMEQAAASRLERALRRLRDLAGCSPLEAQVGEGSGPPVERLVCTLNSPAAPEAIAEVELRLGAALPSDYHCFLLLSDGATLSANAAKPLWTGVELLGTTALVRVAEEMEYNYRAGCIPELVIFAAVGGEGDQLAFETGRMNPFGGCAVLDARTGYRPDQWWAIARDFTSWLEGILHDPTVRTSFGRRWEGADDDEQPALPLSDLEATGTWSNEP